MIRFKITSVVLSVVMCVSMLAIPAAVVADETPDASETQTEVTEKQETKETEKPALNETEKKETEAEEAEPDVTEEQSSKVEAKNKTATSIIYSGNCKGSDYDVQYELDNKGTLTIKGEGKVPDALLDDLSYREKIKSIVIAGDKISSIADICFYGYVNLESVKIPASIKTIGEGAFQTCAKLKKAELAKGLEKIGCNAFQGCKDLKEISIPDSVTFVGGQAFKECTNLAKVKLSNKMTSIEFETFYGCLSLTSISVPDGVSFIGDSAFYGCSKLSSVSLPATLNIIEDDCFNDCISLKGIYLPDSITSIGGAAFQGCTALESITLPAGIDIVSAYLFYGCTSLKRLDIPKKVYLIADAFEGCNSLTEVNYAGSKDDVDINTSSVDITGFINYETKSTNRMAASGKTATVKYKKLKKKAQKVSRASVMTVSHPDGKVTYKLVSVSKSKFKKYFKISSAGVVSIKKKLKKGTYTIKCKVTAAGTENFDPGTKTVTFKIKVK